MIVFLALMAALGCAIFNGAAAILEKVGAGKEAAFTTSRPEQLWKLRGNIPYLAGLILDVFAWLFTLFAVHELPLFVVQPIIACSVVVTVLIEHFLFKRSLSTRFLVGLGAVVAGLILLALVASPETSMKLGHDVRNTIIFTPIILAIAGTLFVSINKHFATLILAAVSGLAFGGVSVTARSIRLIHPYYHIVLHPSFYALIADGLIGILFFTIALQRASATVVNAVMIGSETLFAILSGLILLGDHPKNKLWLFVIAGIILSLLGTMLIALSYNEKAIKAKL